MQEVLTLFLKALYFNIADLLSFQGRSRCNAARACILCGIARVSIVL